MDVERLVIEGNSLVELSGYLLSLFGLVSLCTIRIYAAMLVLPATNDQLLTGLTRNGVALCLGVFVALGQPIGLVEGLSPLHWAALGLKEALLGMLIGLACSTVFWIAEGVGVLIDNQAGFNNVQQTNPMSGQQSTPVGNLLMQLAILAFYMLGGLVVFTGLLLDSYQWWPLRGALPSGSQLLDRFLPNQVTTYAETVLKIAGPVVVTLTLIDLAVGLLGKAAEKLEPGSLGQPIKGATALLMLVMLVAVFFHQAKPQLTLRPVAAEIERLLAPAPPSSAASAAPPAR